jgi:hypothetical protein
MMILTASSIYVQYVVLYSEEESELSISHNVAASVEYRRNEMRATAVVELQ